MKDILINGISKEKEKEKEFMDIIRIANTGHLMFTTIAQNNAVEGYQRLIKLGVKK